LLLLITGGSGFIGSNLISFYIEKKIPLINIDINKPRVNGHLKYWKNICLLNYDELVSFIENVKPTHVIHLASRTDLEGKSIEDYAVNYRGTRNLFSALNRTNSVVKVIFTSSMLVTYPGYKSKSNFDYCPKTLYGESKVLMEKLLFANSFNFNWIIIRPTSIWGPWFSKPYKDFFETVQSGLFFKISNKAGIKTYGFVLNSVFQIDKLLFNNSANGSVFYIGDNPPLNISKWADDLSLKMHQKKTKQLPFFIFKLAAFVGDILKVLGINSFPMSSFRLRNMMTDNIAPLDNTYQITGALPYSINDGIDKTISWMNQNEI
jgi:nucleoside-diphosphate-sugar epimerase